MRADLKDPSTQPLLYEQDGYRATITINRPDQHNAMSEAMWVELGDLAERIAADPGVRVVVIRGAGGRAFASGADIAELERIKTVEAAAGFRDHLGRALAGLEDLPVPVIAMIEGYALGGGCELAMACDLRIASEEAVLGIPSGRLGVVLSMGEVSRLIQLVGPARAMELLLTGRRVGAREAAEIGLVNQAVGSAELPAFVDDLAREIVQSAPLSVRSAKRTVATLLKLARGTTEELLKAAQECDDLSVTAFLTADFREGARAFREKRPPRWQGR